MGKSIQSRIKRTLKRQRIFINVCDVVVVEYGEVIFRCDKSQIRHLQKKKSYLKIMIILIQTLQKQLMNPHSYFILMMKMMI